MSKVKKLYILFSESVIGSHHRSSSETEVFITIPITFPPRVNKVGGKLVFASNLSNNLSFKYGIQSYLDGKKRSDQWSSVRILVGFDYDEAGHAMSESIREQLISAGVSPEDIYRTPLTEAGYILLQEFVDTENIKRYLYLQQQYQSRLRKNGISKNVGFAKALSLMQIAKGRGLFFNIKGVNENGTSTVTIVSNSPKKDIS